VLEQMRRVQTGDLNARAVTETQDEIGELAGGFNAMVQSLDDATRELEASHEKQIQQAGKLASIGELASGIAHEIRNPLAGIGAAVEVLAEENNLNGQRAEIVAEIHRQITRLNRTLHDLLEFARLRDPEIAPCDVHGFIRPMLALVRPDAQKFHVKIEEHFAADLPNICADTGQMQQALLNILLNGVQAMPSGGTLTVSTESARRDGGGMVRIKIQDTGVGISRQHLAKIFSPFFTTKHRGTGLGLSITRTIIEKHHGTIAVASEPGKGTTFTLELAACKPEMFASPAGAETRKEFTHAEN
jgi:signal transduction histidine kinase